MSGLFQDYNPFQRAAGANTGMEGQTVKRGSLVSFYYPTSMGVRPNQIHDPYPLVVVADIWPKFIRGVNLHYLTFPYMQKILGQIRSNPNYGYSAIKPDIYLAESFRMYNRSGMQQMKVMDIAFLLRVLGSVRKFSEQEIDRVTNDIIAQINNQKQATANQITQASQTQSPPNPQPVAPQSNPVISQFSQGFNPSLQGGVNSNSFSNQQSSNQSPTPTGTTGGAEG